MSEIKAVIFDVGGVILDWEGPRKNFLNKQGISLEEWEKGFTDSLVTRSNLGEISLDEYVREGLRGAGIEDKFEEWRKVIPGKFLPIKKTIDLSKELKKNFKIGLLTNNHKNLLEEWQEIYGQLDWFDVIVCSAEVKLVKPEREIYLLTANKLGVKSEECLFVDDVDEYIKGARDVGMETVWFRDADLGIKEIKEKLGVV